VSTLLRSLALTFAGAVLAGIPGPVPAQTEEAVPVQVEVLEYTERIIYHSPETPGYTSWVGLWQLPDGRLQCSFNQLTGPRDQPVASVPILQSTDGGETWAQVLEGAQVGGGRGMAVLKDGTLVRGHWAGDPSDAGWTERSTDGGKTWGPRCDFVSPREYRAWPSVIRVLSGGRLVLMAGVWKRGEGELPNPRMTKLMFVSADEGRSWGPPLELMPTAQGVCEESDCCELPSGDLFWIHRVEHFPADAAEVPPGVARMGEPFPTGYSDRMQSVVYKWRDGWKAGPATPAPFAHSGYPEVLLTAEDLVLHLATDGIYWSDDVGGTWTRLPIAGSSYYPRALQLADGKIICLGHVGSDDVYGTVDQAIRQQTFRLKVTRPGARP
jgi:hypothetical protein